MNKKKILSFVAFFALTIINTAFGIELKQFNNYQSSKAKEETSIGFIDLSDFSMKWLEENRKYLIQKKIPVLVINTNDENRIKDLYQVYSEKNEKLLIAIAPKPLDYLNLIYKQLDIRYYPSVYENGWIWQERK